MKHFLTLLFAVAFLGTTQAQSSTTERAKTIIRGDRRYYDPKRAEQDEAKSIIRKRRNRNIEYKEPKRKRNGEYSYEYAKRKHKHKKNNGKHLGWYKGKGNPHRNWR